MEGSREEIEAYLARIKENYFNARFLPRAILEDYAKVVAKIEGCDSEDVVDRIERRGAEMAIEDENAG